jgi:translation initiation factor IF-2
VTTPTRQSITFLDTPGHAAFTAMRARGAKATDIVVLVVAADDGVMPQTIEAIQHAQGGRTCRSWSRSTRSTSPTPTPIACKHRTCRKHEIVAEECGGDNMFVHGVGQAPAQGIDQLLEAMLLQAEVLELAAPVDGLAVGSRASRRSIEKGRGAVATVLVKRGTLKLGDPIIAGQEFGRVRAMFDEAGAPVQEAQALDAGAGARPIGRTACGRRTARGREASARHAKWRCIARASSAT